MGRHFLTLYLLIVITLTAVSLGGDWALQRYGPPDAAESAVASVAAKSVAVQLAGMPPDRRRLAVAELSAAAGVAMELYDRTEISGRNTLTALDAGKTTYLQGAAGESWLLQRLDSRQVVAIRMASSATTRGWLEWSLILAFYALIGLVIMIWLWPLSRDLRSLQRAVAGYGDRGWRFDAHIGPHSQVYPLADTFRRMAERIDRLIASHRDMTNAVSHEIRTPLSRMRFAIELALQSSDPSVVTTALGNVRTDVTRITDLATATLGYASLERADLKIDSRPQDLAALIRAVATEVSRDTSLHLVIEPDIRGDASGVVCDAHLIETVLRNLLGNATRYARQRIVVGFETRGASHILWVEDDGPGVQEADRQRVFSSFVRLDPGAGEPVGFGLGLAIVRHAAERHGGDARVTDSALGGARFEVHWPTRGP